MYKIPHKPHRFDQSLQIDFILVSSITPHRSIHSEQSLNSPNECLIYEDHSYANKYLCDRKKEIPSLHIPHDQNDALLYSSWQCRSYRQSIQDRYKKSQTDDDVSYVCHGLEKMFSMTCVMVEEEASRYVCYSNH